MGLDLSLHLGKAMQVLIPPTTANAIAPAAPATQGGPNVAFHAFLSEAAAKGAEDSGSTPARGEDGGVQSDRAESRDRADKKRVNADSSEAGLTTAAPVLLAVAVPPMVQQQPDATSGIPEGLSEDSTDSGALAAMPGIVASAAGTDAGATQAVPAVAGQMIDVPMNAGMAAAKLMDIKASGPMPSAGAPDPSSAASKQTGGVVPTTGIDHAETETTTADLGAALPNASVPQKSVADAGSVSPVQERGMDVVSRGPSRSQTKAAATGISVAGDKPEAATGADSQNTPTQKNDATEKQVVALPPAMPLMTVPVPQPMNTNVDVPPSGQNTTGSEGNAGVAGLNATGKKAAGGNKSNAGPAMSLTGISPDDQGTVMTQTTHGTISAIQPAVGGDDAGSPGHRDASQSAAAMMVPASAAHGNGEEAAQSVVPESAPVPPAVVPDGAMAMHAPAINSAKLIQKMNESEMHVGMQTAEFGSISVRTSMVHEQLSAQISFDHAELGRAMSQHLASMQTRLGEEYGMNARIEIRDSGTSYTSDADRGSRGGQQDSNPRGSFQRFQAGAVMATGSGVAQLNSISSDSARLDVRI